MKGMKKFWTYLVLKLDNTDVTCSSRQGDSSFSVEQDSIYISDYENLGVVQLDNASVCRSPIRANTILK